MGINHITIEYFKYILNIPQEEIAPPTLSLYHRRMSIGALIQAWRLYKKCSLASLSNRSGLSPDQLEQMEADLVDPTMASMQAIAAALGIPPAWLFDSPQSFLHLFEDSDEGEDLHRSQSDPVTGCILDGSRIHRSLYVLLTTLIQTNDPKLLRTVEINLRSLVKQAGRTTVPWQTRPSGHFEPPSD